MGVTADGQRALVRLGDIGSRRTPPLFRWVQVSDNRVLEEWREPGLTGVPRESVNDDGSHKRADMLRDMNADTAFAADISKHTEALLQLATALEDRFAVSQGSKYVVLNGGDWLYVADRKGKVLSRVSSDASYRPKISPDGKWLAYHRLVGSLDGVVGNYVVFLGAARPGAPSQRVRATRDVGDPIAWDPSSKYVYTRQGAEQPKGGCLVRIDAKPPYAVQKLACAPDCEELHVGFSPQMRYGLLSSKRGGPQPVMTLRWVRLPGGERAGEQIFDGYASQFAISDSGVVVTELVRQGNTDLAVIDPKLGLRRSAKREFVSILPSTWIGDTLVVGGGDGVETIDVSKLDLVLMQ